MSEGIPIDLGLVEIFIILTFIRLWLFICCLLTYFFSQVLRALQHN